MASFDRIRQVLRDGPPLRVAILFGSRARGAPRHDSDYDLAILPVDPELPLSQETLLAASLEQAAGAPFDVVRLDRAVPALRWRIARDGIVLLSHPPHAAPRFLAREAIEHDELSSLEVEAARRYRARLASTHPSSTP